jgi:hypothetical protein
MKASLLFISVLLFFSAPLLAQSKTESQVAAAVENLRKVMVDPDRDKLSDLVADGLSYGHSSGKIEDKSTFMEALLSGKSDFKNIDLSDQTITTFGKTAIVRHTLSANLVDNNQPGTVKLAVLTVWQKQHGQWKLLARQAVRAS